MLFGLEIKGGGSGTEAWADLVIRVPRGRKLSVHSIAGSGEVQNVDGRLLIDGGSGGVNAGKCSGELKIDIGSGAVKVAGFEGDLDIDTGSGSVRVTVPQDFGATVYLETGSGGIRTELPIKIDVKDDGVLRGSVGDGAGRLHVDTGSGGVSLLTSGGPGTTGAMKFKSR